LRGAWHFFFVSTGALADSRGRPKTSKAAG
jgi:hypothetical protein